MLLVSFDSPLALEAALAGGKGANLAKLTQAGFPVPSGVVVSAKAYETFIAHSPVAALLAHVGELPFHDAAALETACRKLMAELALCPMPEGIASELADRLSLDTLTTYSVRSSATTEDLGGAAFAGQHETYLNCQGLAEICRRIKDCWISLWSARAVAYRQQAGFDVASSRMAVVVQEMVNCDVAGVGFCVNPISGKLTEQVLDANYGLGESVVGGETAVDHFVVDRETGKVVQADIGNKRESVRAVAGGTEVREVPPEHRGEPCLTVEQVAELSRLMAKVEKLYGFPQDIEWGLAGSKLWLLQSRPITRIPPRFTRDESEERFPSVITPLAWELVEEGFHKSLNYSFALLGLPPFAGKWFAMFDHYIYGDQNAVELYAEGLGSRILNALPRSSVSELAKALAELRRRYNWVLELPLTWSRDLDYYLMAIGELMAEDLSRKNEHELWLYVERVKALGATYFLPNIAISITQRTLYKMLLGLLTNLVGPAQAQGTFDELLAYCETKTGVINKELFRLAKRVRERAELARALRGQDSTAFLADGGFAAFPDIEATFGRLLRDHGHREVEFDPYHPTWAGAPWLVLDNIKAMLDSEVEDPAEKEIALKHQMRAAEDALVAKLPSELRFAVQELVRLARVYTSLDDVEHYQTTRLTLPFRRGLLALGERLVKRGVITEPSDVFFARCEALKSAFVLDSPAGWRALGESIVNEKAAYLRHRALTPPHEQGKAPEATQGSGDLRGLAGSPGMAAGPVYKVCSSSDFAGFPKGAVLVARTTNPAWTPLFYKACAIVTESGGPLSHGAVTAREIGIPAVMSVKGALSRFANGQVLRVDGSNGVVYDGRA